MRWISALLVVTLLLAGALALVNQWQQSKVVRIYIPILPSAEPQPWTAFTSADRSIVYATHTMLFRYAPSGAVPELAENATSSDLTNWVINLKPAITASEVIQDWSNTLLRGDPTVVGKIFYYIQGGQSYKNNAGPFTGLKATATHTLQVITTFPLNLPLLLCDPVFALSSTTQWTYGNSTLARSDLTVLFTSTPTNADIIWVDNGNLFTGMYDYAVSATTLPKSASTCAGVPVADLSQVESITPTAFYVPAPQPPAGKVYLYPWQLDYPADQAFRLGIAVIRDKPSIATSTIPIEQLFDQTRIYVANPQCFSLKVSERISSLDVYLNLLDLRNLKKRLF